MNRYLPFRMLFSTLMMLVLSVSLLPMQASAQQPDAASPIMVPNPAADLWRAVRQRDAAASGRTQVAGVDTGVLIQTSGEDFRTYRQEDFVGTAGIVLVVTAGLVLLFFFAKGTIPIPGGRSGRKIRRFPDFDRVLHWFTAILFIFLAVTGLTLLFGRFVVLPVIGAEAFSVIASACKEGHNLFGPLFLFSIAAMFIRWAGRNIPHGYDLRWLIKGGGIVGSAHVEAGYFNAGEKIWFWSVILLGLAIILSGLILLFPVLGLTREIMQLALVVHGIVAILFIAGSFGHIYIGTLGTQGSLESMSTGFVDENWARAHHDLWYAEVKRKESQRGRTTAHSAEPARDADGDSLSPVSERP